MAYKVNKVDVWAADILNRPGTLARVLDTLKNAGAQLEFVLARRAGENTSRVFMYPITGPEQQQAAGDVGLVPATGMHAIRIQSRDKSGLGAELTRAIAERDINLRGVSAAVIGGESVTYLAFENSMDLDNASEIIRKTLDAMPMPALPRPKAARGPAKRKAKKTAKRTAKKKPKKAAKKSAKKKSRRR